MTAEKHKKKSQTEINARNLLFLCRSRGLSVAGLARKINRSRQAVYFAVENPRRLPVTFNLIKNVLL
jgi:hypothetical protein